MLSTIRTIIRSILGDSAQTTPPDIFTFVNSRIFTLTEPNVVSVNSVLVNDVNVDMSGNWSYNATLNKVTFENSYTLNADDTIQINFSYYSDYSDNELTDAIKYALVKLSMAYGLFSISGTNVNPEPREDQQNLIALIASILLRPENKSIRLPDISITQSSNLSSDERIDKIISHFKMNPGKFTFLNTFRSY